MYPTLLSWPSWIQCFGGMSQGYWSLSALWSHSKPMMSWKLTHAWKNYILTVTEHLNWLSLVLLPSTRPLVNGRDAPHCFPSLEVCSSSLSLCGGVKPQNLRNFEREELEESLKNHHRLSWSGTRTCDSDLMATNPELDKAFIKAKNVLRKVCITELSRSHPLNIMNICVSD